MIRCPACQSVHASDLERCPQCGWSHPEVDGFPAWAPELADGGTGLPGESFELLAHYEAGHFWFESRSQVIVWALQTYFPQLHSFLEIGCGTGVVLKNVVNAFPAAAVTGTEVSTSGLAVAAKRLPRVALMQMDARRMPFEKEFDVVAAFDVLEHIVEDEAVLGEMCRAVVPGGGIVVSVPQHDWLWSAVDDYSRHQRRYSRRELVRKLEAAGFALLHVTSFMTLILPAMLLSRLVKRDPGTLDPAAELKVGKLTNSILGKLCAAERRLLMRGVSLPVGGSLFAVARKI